MLRQLPQRLASLSLVLAVRLIVGYVYVCVNINLYESISKSFKVILGFVFYFIEIKLNQLHAVFCAQEGRQWQP